MITMILKFNSTSPGSSCGFTVNLLGSLLLLLSSGGQCAVRPLPGKPHLPCWGLRKVTPGDQGSAGQRRPLGSRQGTGGAAQRLAQLHLERRLPQGRTEAEPRPSLGCGEWVQAPLKGKISRPGHTPWASTGQDPCPARPPQGAGTARG